MSPRDRLSALRKLLFSPGEFFESHPPSRTLAGAAAVVLVVAIVTTVGFGVLGWLFAENIDATVTETVMEPWSNATCQGFADMNATSNVSMGTPEPCAIDEPKTRQVDIGSRLQDAIVGRIPVVFVSSFVGWLLVGVALHVASAIAGGRGSFRGSLAVAGWGSVPTILAVIAGVTSAAVTLGSIEFASDPAALRDQIEALSATGLGPVSTAVSVAGTLWQGYIWTFGIAEARDLDRGPAVFAAAAVTLILLALNLV